jgi:hypothetical protein
METQTQQTETTKAPLPKKRRKYNRRSAFEKKEFLSFISQTLGTNIVTRKQLVTLISEGDGRPWNAFSFIVNDKACYVAGSRGVYDLTKVPLKED